MAGTDSARLGSLHRCARFSMMPPMRDRPATSTGATPNRFWRIAELRNLELLHAQQVTHDGPRHIHDQYEITLIERGAAILRHRGNDFAAPAGSIVVIPPGEAHQLKSHRNHAWSGRTFFTDAAALRATIASLDAGLSAPVHFPSLVIHDRMLGRALRKLHILLASSGSLLEQEQFAVATGAQLVLAHSVSPPASPQTGREQRLILEAREYLHAHFARNVSLSELAQLTCLSPFHFLRAFRNATGMPPHEYLLQLRINRARQLFLQGRSPLDVALETGFYDQSHFARHFRRIVGTTPARYRDAHLAA